MVTGRPRPEGTDAPATKRDGATVSEHRLRVLVVDDNEDTRKLYAAYLGFHGAAGAVACDGVEALQAVVFERPDVVILDLAMPKLGGLDVIRTVKRDAQTRAIPIVVLSGQQMRDQALEAGAHSYFEKPCLPDVLLREILRVLRDPKRDC